MDQVTVRCQFCNDLFVMTRPLFVGERDRVTCPSCRAEAERDTKRKRRAIGDDPIALCRGLMGAISSGDGPPPDRQRF